MDTILSPKVAIKYSCKKCNYTCSKESDYNKHLTTTKHKKSYKGVTKELQKSPKVADYGVKSSSVARKSPKVADANFVCDCGKLYKYRQGLYKHRKTCYINEKETINIISKSIPTDIDKEMLVKVLINNQDIMEKMMVKNQDVMEKMIVNLSNIGNNSHNHTNSHNTNNFNVQMFLNEHCKNAMNLTEFIDSLPITNETYDHTIENGLTQTITHMITDGLNNMDVLERPIHCTDSSRKTLYIKDNDVWEKDNELNKIVYGIKKIALKQRTMINKWQQANNGWDVDENLQTKMTNLVCNSMTDIENDTRETGKIIRAISKNTYLTNEIKNEYKSI